MNDETLLEIAWLDDENIFHFPLDPPLVTISPIRSAEELLLYAPNQRGSVPLTGDMIICDFKLVVAADRASPEVLAAGLDMDAAGFLAGLFLAMNDKDRPLAVIPYSGQQSQFKELWKLSKAFCPRWVIIGLEENADHHVVDKSNWDPRDQVNRAVQAYRQLLRKLIEEGLAEVEGEDRAFLLQLGSPSFRKKQKVDFNQTISVFFGRRRRNLRLASLFYDLIVNEVDASRRFDGNKGSLDPIADYFSFLRSETTEEAQARKVAQTYFDAAQTQLSIDIYESALTGDASDQPAKPLNWLKIETTDAVFPLAVLRLFVMAYCRERCVAEAITKLHSDLYIDSPTLLDKFTLDKVEEALLARGIISENDKFFRNVLQKKIDWWTKDYGLLLEDLAQYYRGETRMGRTLQTSFIQCLDPLPKDGKVITSLAKDARIGARLAEHFLDPETGREQSATAFAPPFNRVAIRLSSNNLRYVQGCCLEMIPSTLETPEFLS